MFQLIEDDEAILAAQQDLEATFSEAFSKRAVKNIGYPGGTMRSATVATDGTHWFWSHMNTERNGTPRRLNWFGEFDERRSLDIGLEVNISPAGVGDRVAGAFAKDIESGLVYLMHTGGIGGGTSGVGKFKFLAWTNHQPIAVANSAGVISNMLVVMPVSGQGAVDVGFRYVQSVLDFKAAARRGETSSQPGFDERENLLRDFYAEPRGRRSGHRSPVLDYVSRHGEVVDALRDWREKKGLPAHASWKKNVLIDLGLSIDGKTLVELYEVKSSAQRQSVYTAIGQLLVHGGTATHKVVALPADGRLPADVESALGSMGIQVVRYALRNDKVEVL